MSEYSWIGDSTCGFCGINEVRPNCVIKIIYTIENKPFQEVAKNSCKECYEKYKVTVLVPKFHRLITNLKD